MISIEDSSQTFIKQGRLKSLGWSEDGQWIYVVDRNIPGLNIFRISLKNNQTEMVLHVPPSQGVDHASALQVSMTPDGRSFIFPVFQRYSDIWVIENFDPYIK